MQATSIPFTTLTDLMSLITKDPMLGHPMINIDINGERQSVFFDVDHQDEVVDIYIVPTNLRKLYDLELNAFWERKYNRVKKDPSILMVEANEIFTNIRLNEDTASC